MGSSRTDEDSRFIRERLKHLLKIPKQVPQSLCKTNLIFIRPTGLHFEQGSCKDVSLASRVSIWRLEGLELECEVREARVALVSVNKNHFEKQGN